MQESGHGQTAEEIARQHRVAAMNRRWQEVQRMLGDRRQPINSTEILLRMIREANARENEVPFTRSPEAPAPGFLEQLFGRADINILRPDRYGEGPRNIHNSVERLSERPRPRISRFPPDRRNRRGR